MITSMRLMSMFLDAGNGIKRDGKIEGEVTWKDTGSQR